MQLFEKLQKKALNFTYQSIEFSVKHKEDTELGEIVLTVWANAAEEQEQTEIKVSSGINFLTERELAKVIVFKFSESTLNEHLLRCLEMERKRPTYFR